MDEQFIKKVYKSSIILWATAVLCTLAAGKPWIALSISLGVMVSIAGLASYDYMVHRVFVPGGRNQKRSLFRLALVKFPLLLAVLYLVVRWNKINLLAFCSGIVLTHIAMLAKLAGIKLVEILNSKEDQITDPSSGDRENRLGT